MKTRLHPVNAGLVQLQQKEARAVERCQGLPGALAAAELLSAALAPPLPPS